MSPLSESLTTVGSVTFDERRLARISSKLKGMSRVEKLAVNFTGTPVEAGDVLAEVYNPELYQTVRELLLAQAAVAGSRGGRARPGDDPCSVAERTCSAWRPRSSGSGASPRPRSTRFSARARPRPGCRSSPRSGGVVVRKNVVEGQYVAEGDPLFEIADLSHVWILAQVYEDQMALVRVRTGGRGDRGGLSRRGLQGQGCLS